MFILLEFMTDNKLWIHKITSLDHEWVYFTTIRCSYLVECTLTSFIILYITAQILLPFEIRFHILVVGTKCRLQSSNTATGDCNVSCSFYFYYIDQPSSKSRRKIHWNAGSSLLTKHKRRSWSSLSSSIGVLEGKLFKISTPLLFGNDYYVGFADIPLKSQTRGGK